MVSVGFHASTHPCATTSTVRAGEFAVVAAAGCCCSLRITIHQSKRICGDPPRKTNPTQFYEARVLSEFPRSATRECAQRPPPASRTQRIVSVYSFVLCVARSRFAPVNNFVSVFFPSFGLLLLLCGCEFARVHLHLHSVSTTTTTLPRTRTRIGLHRSHHIKIKEEGK